jgi:N-acetylglutamate synthase-like GNAT family acetyltransferase
MEIVKEATYREMKILAQHEGKTIGTISLVAPIHIEGIFIEPEHRGNGVMKKLVREAEHEALNLNVEKVFAFAINAEMENYIERLGYRKHNWTVWEKVLQCR